MNEQIREQFIKHHSRKFFWEQKKEELKEAWMLFAAIGVVVFLCSLDLLVKKYSYILWGILIIMGTTAITMLLMEVYHWIQSNKRKARKRAEALWSDTVIEECQKKLDEVSRDIKKQRNNHSPKDRRIKWS